MAINTVFQSDNPFTKTAAGKADNIQISHLQSQKRSLVYRGCQYTLNSWESEPYSVQVEGQFRGGRSIISLPISVSPRPEISQIIYRGVPVGG